MIAYIKGEVAWIEEERIVLESGNIGYNIMMPASSFDIQTSHWLLYLQFLHLHR